MQQVPVQTLKAAIWTTYLVFNEPYFHRTEINFLRKDHSKSSYQIYILQQKLIGHCPESSKKTPMSNVYIHTNSILVNIMANTWYRRGICFKIMAHRIFIDSWFIHSKAIGMWSRSGVTAWLYFCCGMRAVPEHNIWCLGCLCLAAEQIILDLILSLPEQNCHIKIFRKNLKHHYEHVPVLYLVTSTFSSFHPLPEAWRLFYFLWKLI